MLKFKCKLFSSTFQWYRLVVNILRNEICFFCVCVCMCVCVCVCFLGLGTLLGVNWLIDITKHILTLKGTMITPVHVSSFIQALFVLLLLPPPLPPIPFPGRSKCFTFFTKRRSHQKLEVLIVLALRGEKLNYKTSWAPDKTVAMDDF